MVGVTGFEPATPTSQDGTATSATLRRSASSWRGWAALAGALTSACA